MYFKYNVRTYAKNFIKKISVALASVVLVIINNNFHDDRTQRIYLRLCKQL